MMSKLCAVSDLSDLMLCNQVPSGRSENETPPSKVELRSLGLSRTFA